MKMNRTLIIGMLIGLWVAAANAGEYGVLTYTESGGEVTITGCETTASGAMGIPSMIDGYPVTSIDTRVFQSCTQLTTVNIPTNVTTIGDYLFYGCTGLTSAVIPASVTSIANTFYGCYALSSLTLLDDVTSIASSLCSGRSGLTSVTIPNTVTNIGTSAFSGCSGLASLTIPSSVETIDTYAFNGCSGLTSFTIPSNVKSIGDYGFDSCSGLTSLTISSGVTNIGTRAFQSCTQLTTVTIPTSVTTIGGNLFYGCTGLASAAIPASVTSVGDTFYGCYALSSLTLLDDITSIAPSFCNGRSGLTSVTIPNSVTNIGTSAFNGCSGLTSLTLPDSVTSIDDNAFYGCGGIMTLTNSAALTTIGDNAFHNCDGLSSVTFPPSVTSIGDAAFRFCDGLTGLYFIGNAPSLGNVALDSTTLTVFRTAVATGWPTVPDAWGGRPTALWVPPVEEVQLQVNSLEGSPSPVVGPHTIIYNTAVTCSVANVESGGIQYECTGWTGTGSIPASGISNAVEVTLTEDSSIIWTWATNYLLDITISGSGSVDADDAFYVANSEQILTATPDRGWLFMGWSGDAYGTNNAVLTMDTPQAVSATFSDDADGDGLLNSNETAMGSNPWKKDTDDDGFDDAFEVAQGLNVINNSSAVVDYIANKGTTFGLYPSNAVFDVAVGQMLLQTVSSNAVLNLQLEKSDDLITWTNAGEAVEWIWPVDGNKKFFRIRSYESF